MLQEVNWEEENWTAWEERYGATKPENVCYGADRVEILATRSGYLTARIHSSNGKAVYLHSSVDPVKEAERFVAGFKVEPGSVVIVHGFGLGYLVEALLAQINEKIPMFIIEPDHELFYSAMKSRDLSMLINSPQVFIMVGDSEDDVQLQFTHFFNAARFNQITSIGLSGHQTVYAEFFSKIKRIGWETVNVQLLNLVTGIKLGPDMMTNSILNLVDYYTHPGVNALFDKFTNVPAIIVAAGPSLNKNIHRLKEAKGKAVIIAVGTAVKALRKWDLEPDFIVTIDPHILNYEHLKGVDTSQVCMLVDLQVNHNILKDHQGPLFVANNTSVRKWFDDEIENKGYMDSGGSVANSAFAMAYYMGADPIVLVGQDLAYGPDGHSHAAGTNYQDVVAEFAEEDFKKADFLKIKANDGGEVVTSSNFYQFLHFFEYWIKKFPERNYINATEGGAYIEGTKITTLQKVIEQYCQEPVDTQVVIRQAQKDFTIAGMAPFLNIINKKIKILDTAIGQAQKAIRHLKRLEKACEQSDSKKMYYYLNAITKIYDKFSENTFLSNLPEWFAKHELHQVLYRTHKADLSGKDDFHAAIADYRIYYNKVCEAAEKVKGLLENCRTEAERRSNNGSKSL